MTEIEKTKIKKQNEPKSTIFDLQLQRSYPIIVGFFSIDHHQK